MRTPIANPWRASATRTAKSLAVIALAIASSALPAAVAASAAPAGASGTQSCVATPIALGGTVVTGAASQVFQVAQSTPAWSAIAVRAVPGADYDLELYSGFDGSTCAVSGPLGTSGASGARVDLIAGDFHHLAPATVFPRAVRFSGSPSASVTWSQSQGALLSGSPAITRLMAASDLLEIWEVDLDAGVNYAFQFDRSGADLRLLLFGSPMVGSYWGGRNRALLEVTGCTTYTPLVSGTYALIVVNDNGAAGGYRLGVSDNGCACPPALGSGPTAVAAPGAYRLDMSTRSQWFVASVRGAPGSDWNLSVGTDAVSGANCVGGVIAESGETGGVDLVAGDLANLSQPPGVYYAALTRASGGNGAVGELDGTATPLPVGSTISDVMGSGVVELYVADLTAGASYQLAFTRAGAGDTHALLFANPNGAPTFLSRAQRALEIPPGGVAQYTAPMTGHYALVIVNDNGQSGSYTLSLIACAAPPALNANQMTSTGGGGEWYVQPYPGAAFTAAGMRSENGSVTLTSFPGGPGACPGAPQKTTMDVNGHTALLIGTAGAVGPQLDPEPGVGATDAVIEADDGRCRLRVNGCAVTGDATHVMRLYTLHLEAGGIYQLTLAVTGQATFRMALFDPLAQPGVALDRFAAVSESPSNIAYPSEVSRDFALVVVNDNGQPGTYTLQFKGCTTPIPVPADTAYPIVVPEAAKSFLEVQPDAPGWGAVAVRGAGWTTTMFASATGGVTGDCYGTPLAAAVTDGHRVELLAGRFGGDALPVQPWFPMATRTACGAMPADSIEWAAPSSLPMASWVEPFRSGSNLVDAWTASLDGGRAYGIVFEHPDSVAYKLLLFSPKTKPGMQWLARGDATVETGRSVDLQVPGNDAGQPWGLVVVNDNGEPGTYLLGIYLGGAAVGGPNRPPRTELRGMYPNPVRDRLRLEYALSTRAQVRIELMDLAGRRVAVLDDGTREAGVWNLQWRPGAAGAGLHPGLYLMRFTVDGRTLERRKVTILN
jgi:hypothetical protein